MHDWVPELRLGLEVLVEKAVTKGAKQADVFAALSEEIERHRNATERDPDPSEQVINEPANDWPGALKD